MAKKVKEENEQSGLPETTETENTVSTNPAEEFEAAKADKSTAKRTKKVIVSGAEFWKFAPETPGGDFDGVEFIGKYLGEVKREKDGKEENQKAGSVIGYNFEQEGTGIVFIIGNSHAIEKGLEKTGHNTDLVYCIEFLGKGVTAGNKPYNRFEFSVLE